MAVAAKDLGFGDGVAGSRGFAASRLRNSARRQGGRITALVVSTDQPKNMSRGDPPSPPPNPPPSPSRSFEWAGERNG